MENHQQTVPKWRYPALRTLIFGATWCPDEEKRELAKLWARTIEKLSPECDVLLVDCDSPFRPGAFLADLGYSSYHLMLGKISLGQKAVVSFADNIGHLSLGGQDGWGRSFCKGLDIAVASGYDYVAYVEPDMLFSLPVGPIVEKMHRTGVKVACPMECDYRFLANELMFFNCDYLRELRFAEKYDWQNPPPLHPSTIPEMRCEAIIRDDLFLLPIRTYRNDRHMITPDNIATAFPYGIDAITHCKDFAVYEAFLAMKGLLLPSATCSNASSTQMGV